MDLREPKRKRVGPHIKPQQPFPILIESESGILSGSEIWTTYIGNYTGDSVILCDPEEMTSLYSMGFFGKGSFSRGYPSFDLKKKGIPPIIKERQWQRRKCWMNKMKKNLTIASQVQDATSNSDPENNEQVKNSNHKIEETAMDVEASSVDSFPGTQQDLKKIESTDFNFKNVKKSDITDIHNEVLVLADSDDEDIEKVIRDPKPHLEVEHIKTAIETLNLTLEEAFFLSYALGCLTVVDTTGEVMTLKKMWKTFCEVQLDFIESYTVYHYFRAKGWVVKSGYKFGGDFLLYKQGPPFYHASFVVLVEKVDSQLRRAKDSITWTKLHGLNRLAESSGKDIITCQVFFPDNFTSEDLETPKSLARLRVNEVLTKRWIPSQERTEKEQT